MKIVNAPCLPLCVVYFLVLGFVTFGFSFEPSLNAKAFGKMYSITEFGNKDTAPAAYRFNGGLALALTLDTMNYVEYETVLKMIDPQSERIFWNFSKFRLNMALLKTDLIQWRLFAGNTESVTVGKGLTLKDFRDIGGATDISFFDFDLKLALYAQGYPNTFAIVGPADDDTWHLQEDILHTEFKYNYGNSAKIGMNGLLFKSSLDVDRGYAMLFLLPFFEISYKSLNFYAEGGSKYKWSGDWKKEYVNRLAGLTGIGFADSVWGFNFSVNTEYRYYAADFIVGKKHYLFLPVTYYYEYDYYNEPINNWLFFRDNTIWYYLNVQLESPEVKKISLLAGNEIMVTDDFSSVVYFYNVGFRYSPINGMNVKCLLTNKSAEEEVDYGYRPKFITSKRPSLLVSIDWQIAKQY